VREISDRFKAALNTGHKRTTVITCTIPGGETVTIGESRRLSTGRMGPGWTSGSVTSSASSGARYQASLTISPEPGSDTYGLVSTPGAIFRIRHGIDFGVGDVELIDCGVYEAAKPAVDLGGGDIRLSLVDQWVRLVRNEFLDPYYPASGSRAVKIAEVVTEAIPGVVLTGSADGGLYEQGDNLWDHDRTKFINDMAKDGAIDAAFDASGAFRIRPQPIMENTAPVWTFRTGAGANITTAERETPLDRKYNTVVMEPMEETQSWDRQIIVLDDIDHPLHPSKYGPAQFRYRSPTLNTPAEVTAAGVAIMQRFLGVTQTISIGALGNPALEVFDVVPVVKEATATDPGFQALHAIDSFQMDLKYGAMTLATRSSNLADLEES
jgi:hypothetical protein